MLGKKVHALRKAQGLTLKELGESADLSASFLSRVERGLASPTMASLERIADALGASPSIFLPPVAGDGLVVRSYGRHPFRVAEEEVVLARLGADLPGLAMEPLHCTLPPGFVSDEFAHPGEEFVFVLQGRLGLRLDGEAYVLDAGDTIHFASTRVHRLENATDSPVEMVYLTVPPFLSYRAGVSPS